MGELTKARRHRVPAIVITTRRLECLITNHRHTPNAKRPAPRFTRSEPEMPNETKNAREAQRTDGTMANAAFRESGTLTL
jgi:hypothetical protein